MAIDLRLLDTAVEACDRQKQPKAVVFAKNGTKDENFPLFSPKEYMGKTFIVYIPQLLAKVKPDYEIPADVREALNTFYDRFRVANEGESEEKQVQVQEIMSKFYGSFRAVHATSDEETDKQEFRTVVDKILNQEPLTLEEECRIAVSLGLAIYDFKATFDEFAKYEDEDKINHIIPTYMDYLKEARHPWKKKVKGGTSTININTQCIRGFSKEDAYALGYDDHECPACKATSECWKLINLMLDKEGKNQGVTAKNDPQNLLQDVRKKYKEDLLVFDSSSEYVFFPIVIIPTTKNKPTVSDTNPMKVVYFKCRKQAFDERLCADNVTNGESYSAYPEHIAGKIMSWNYNVNNPQNAMTASKDATYSIISDSNILKRFASLLDECETLAKPFTKRKAMEVLADAEMYSYDELVEQVESSMTAVRQLLAIEETTADDTANLLQGAESVALPTEANTTAGTTAGGTIATEHRFMG